MSGIRPRTLALFLAAAAATLSLPSTGLAQRTSSPAAAAPHAGEWAAEAGFGGQFGSASLLHFGTDDHAWLVGLTAVAEHTTEQIISGVPPVTATIETVDAQVGIRRYHGSVESIKPYWGLGVVAGMSHSNDLHTVVGGGYGEFGAAYFPAPHFSLGADGRLQAEYQRITGGATGHNWLANFGLVRLTAAVYF